jgi:hypothetical protein
MAAAVAAMPAAAKAPYCGADTSFKIVLDAWGHTWSEAQQQQLLDRCPEFLPSQGKVDLWAPQQTFWLACARLGGANGLPASEPRWYFGRQVALADRCVLTHVVFHVTTKQQESMCRRVKQQ